MAEKLGTASACSHGNMVGLDSPWNGGGKRAQAHIEESYEVINTLYQEIDDAQLVIEEIVF